METISFILGAGMVVGLLTGIFAVRIYRDVQTLKEQYQVNHDLTRDTHQGIWNSIDEIYRQLDSRFDKFENKISKK
jgi:uncharacterized membrane-anchored protein YhcB (DUF1043 family)